MKRRLSGFTLIELLVVISIITLLVSILLPVLSRAREQAFRTACLSNEKQIGVGLYAYAADNDSYTPSWGDSYSNPFNLRWWNDHEFNPDAYYYATDVLWINEPSFTIAPWHGKVKLGKLIPYYLESGLVFTCPSAIGDDGVTSFPQVSFNAAGLHWTGDYKKFGSADTVLYSAYVTRGGSARIEGFHFHGAAALIDRGAFVYQTQSHDDGYNTLYFDGSASWFSDPSDDVRSTNLYSQSDPLVYTLWEYFDHE